MQRPRNTLSAGRFLALNRHARVSDDEAAARLADRDRREAADNRSEAERWLGDPPLDRSALAQRSAWIRQH